VTSCAYHRVFGNGKESENCTTGQRGGLAEALGSNLANKEIIEIRPEVKVLWENESGSLMDGPCSNSRITPH
jgi:hypothetical protein